MTEYEATWQPVWGKKGPNEPLHGYFLGDVFVPPTVKFEGVGLKGAPDVSARFEIRDGVPEVVDFRITAKPDGRAVRTSDLNGWQPLEGLAFNAFQSQGRLSQKDSNGRRRGATRPHDEREAWAMRNEIERAQTKPKGPNMAELKEVAQIYRDAIDGRPTEAVQVMGGYSRRTAARRVQQARTAGLLPATTPGKKKG